MEKILTVKEWVRLIERHRKERDGRARDRIKAVLAYDDGYIPLVIEDVKLVA